MKPSIEIRAASEADIPFLVDCNAAMALETEHKMLDRTVLTRGARGVFEEPRRGFYRVAERAGEAVGSLMVTYEWSEIQSDIFNYEIRSAFRGAADANGKCPAE